MFVFRPPCKHVNMVFRLNLVCRGRCSVVSHVSCDGNSASYLPLSYLQNESLERLSPEAWSRLRATTYTKEFIGARAYNISCKHAGHARMHEKIYKRSFSHHSSLFSLFDTFTFSVSSLYLPKCSLFFFSRPLIFLLFITYSHYYFYQKPVLYNWSLHFLKDTPGTSHYAKKFFISLQITRDVLKKNK